jgi:hypothetical protein
VLALRRDDAGAPASQRQDEIVLVGAEARGGAHGVDRDGADESSRGGLGLVGAAAGRDSGREHEVGRGDAVGRRTDGLDDEGRGCLARALG